LDWLSPLQEGLGVPFTLLDSLPGLRAILGLILVFFLPGFTWTLVFFRQVNILERLALSVGLSIAMVTLSILALHKIAGVTITGFNSVLIIIVVTIIPLALYYLNRLMRTH